MRKLLVVAALAGGLLSGLAQAQALIPPGPYLHRSVCSGRWQCYAQIRTTMDGQIVSHPFAPVGGFGPSDLVSAYKLNTSAGTGKTVAIVDAFGYANAESDLATYRSNYGLPACTTANGCFKKVNQDGQTSPLPGDPTAADDWTVETALDLDMVSSGCPACKILLVQTNSDQDNGLFIAQQSAVTAGATVISNSWGGGETGMTPDAGGTANDFEFYFVHPSVATFASSGDNGYDNQTSTTNPGPNYPATSFYVNGVGGTTLSKAAGTRGWKETAWSAGGSACSFSIPKPSWQGSTSCNFKASSDVAAVGDPNTGVAVYNNGPSNQGWTIVGGTSAASPFIAAVYAAAGQGGVSPQFSYLHTSAFYDVTQGSNGTCGNILCNAATGWDGPTGNGTPNGVALGGIICTPNCAGRVCGPDGCGGTCAPNSCPTGQSCNDVTGQCVCVPQCSGKNCGPDGCGSVCGTCTGTQTCNGSGVCMSCVPMCSGKNCGPDGCGSVCGTCTGTQTCNGSGVCTSCTPQCSGKNCGPDSCGSTCGTCTGTSTCNGSGVCVSPNAPTISFTSPTAGSSVSGPATVVLSTTNTTGSSSIVVQLDGNPFGTATGTAFNQAWDTTTASNGTHTLSALVSESGQSGTAALTVTVANSVTATITNPTAGQVASGRLSITATAKPTFGATLSNIELYVDGILAGSGSSTPATALLDTTRLANGAHTLTAKGYDTSGATGTSAAVSVTFQNSGGGSDAGSGGGADAGTGNRNGGGGGCNASGVGPELGFALAGLFALIRRRRKS